MLHFLGWDLERLQCSPGAIVVVVVIYTWTKHICISINISIYIYVHIFSRKSVRAANVVLHGFQWKASGKSVSPV